MAVLLRCLPSPPAPNPGDSLRSSACKSRHSEQMVLLSCKEPKTRVIPSEFAGLSRKCKIFLSSYMKDSKRDYHVSNSKESCVINGRFSGLQDPMVKYFSTHQKMGPFIFTEALAITNSVLFIMPPNVLAETCETDNSFFNMPLLFAIAMIGATVGGLLARQRRGELKRLNDQLRQINAALRRQAKIESYAPNLSYAPVGSRMAEAEVIVDPRKEQLISSLRTGKNYLRNQDPEKAFAEFKAALELAQSLADHVEEKKAARGLGASLQRQGKHREAIKYHSMVLDISKRAGEDSGVTEAYGAIADCYTELGELEQAGRFYDKYIARLEKD